MKYISYYSSPLGKILLAADEIGLTGLWFEGQKCYPADLGNCPLTEELPVFSLTKRWLDLYFSGIEPDFTPPLHLRGTDFQHRVWEALLSIPYGHTTTYGSIAAALGIRSAQAVGGAVGRNNISIIVPCHRVLGAHGTLIGYAGGLDKKEYLLHLEGIL